MKVSVVIPTYDAADFVHRAIDSVLTQTMAPHDVEIICVDDGSTDHTMDRLSELARTQPRLRVIGIPASGWPGRPRNVGTDAAVGEYVMYLDQDDRLEPEALERMYALGSANDADVVLGKVTSDFRGVHQYLYRDQRPRCTPANARLMNSLTPHKMLRRAFLLEEGLRFPEGRRRLEDQVFMADAYLRARNCSIVADYVCYRYLQRPDGQHSAAQTVTAEAYLGYLREVLDVVDQHTEPGPAREEVYRRFLRVELLGRLSGKQVRRTPVEHGDRWLLPIRALVEERFSPSVDQGLPVLLRLRAHLTRHGSYADLKRLTERTRLVRPSAQVRALEPAGSGLALQVRGTLLHDRRPLRLEPSGDGSWLLPDTVTGPVPHADLAAVDPNDVVADIVVVDRRSHDEWFVDQSLPVTLESTHQRPQLRFDGRVALDPTSLAGGRPLPAGRHDLMIRLDALGLSRLVPVHSHRRPAAEEVVAAFGARGTEMLVVAPGGRMSIEVGGDTMAEQHVGVRAVRWRSDHLRVELSTAWYGEEPTARLRSSRGAQLQVPLFPEAQDRRVWRSRAGAVRPGRYRVSVAVLARPSEVETPLRVRGPVTRCAGRVRRRLRRIVARLRVGAGAQRPGR